MKSFSIAICIVLLSSFCRSNKKISTSSPTHGLSIYNKWIISSLDEESSFPVSKHSFIVIDEEKHRVTGNGGCNNLFGIVLIKGSKIKFDRMASTKMACDHLGQERAFIKALQVATSFKIVGCELFLYHEDQQVLVLESCR